MIDCKSEERIEQGLFWRKRKRYSFWIL